MMIVGGGFGVYAAARTQLDGLLYAKYAYVIPDSVSGLFPRPSFFKLWINFVGAVRTEFVACSL